MKFSEFKNPQLTEEQIVLSYCKGDITKEDAVSHLSEMRANLNEFDLRDYIPGRRFFNNSTWGAIDSPEEQDAYDKAVAAVIKRGGSKAAQRIAGDAAIKKASGQTVPGFGNTGPLNTYYDATLDPANKKKTNPNNYTDANRYGLPLDTITAIGAQLDRAPGSTEKPKMNYPKFKKERPDTKTPEKPKVEPKKEPESFGAAFKRNRKKHGGPGGVFTWNGKQYQTNVKGEKYVKNPTPVNQPISTTTPGQGAAERFLKYPTKSPTPGQGVMNVKSNNTSYIDKGPYMMRNPDANTVKKSAPTIAKKTVDKRDMVIGPDGKKTPFDQIKTPNIASKKLKAKIKPRTLGKQNSKMPKSFGGFGPRVDDPKGGETVNLPFGLSYKTLPQEKDDGSKG